MELTSLGFYIGHFFIAYYGLMIIVGIGAAAAIGWYQTRRYHLSFDTLILISAVAGLFGIIGAKILYILVSLDQIEIKHLLEPAYFNSLMQGGFVFYGGLLGALAGFLFCHSVLKLPVRSYISKALPCIPAAHGFGRLGCSLVGCCYGCPYDGMFSITYTDSLFAPNHTPLFPIQGMEAILEFAISIFLLIYINRLSGKSPIKWYLSLYATARFILEFFRYDSEERGMFFFFSTSQCISLLILLALIALQIFNSLKKAQSRR